MLDVKQAAKTAVEYFSQVFQDGYQNLRLEEVELSEDEHYWYITLGFDSPYQHLGALASMAVAGRPLREYKTIKIDATMGKVLSIKIRTV
jgi:hypothetical protein